MDGVHLKKPSYKLVDGHRVPMGFPETGFRSARDYEPEAGDIFVATYPKCGTTWVQYIVYMLVHRGRELAETERLDAVFPHLEEVGRRTVEALKSPRLIKTHWPVSLTPMAEAARYIVVARNPFDCAVSFYHHTRGFPQHYDFADGSFAAFFECFIAGEVDSDDYFDHLLGWLEQARRKNVLWLTYEDLRADTRAGVVRIGRFLGGAAADTAADEALLERVLAETGFEGMRRAQQRWSSRRAEGAPPFVRRGVVGDWRSLFTSAQARRLAARFDERTRGTLAASLWPDVLAAARNC